MNEEDSKRGRKRAKCIEKGEDFDWDWRKEEGGTLVDD
jgi:hypothetical protein